MVEEAQISPATVSKIAAGENVTMEVVEEVCMALKATMNKMLWILFLINKWPPNIVLKGK